MSAKQRVVKGKLSKLDDPVEISHRRSPPQSSLCTRCVELRLEEVLGEIEPPVRCSYGTPFDVKIADVGQYYRHQLVHGCKLCHLLSASRVPFEELGLLHRDHEAADELHVFNLSDHLSWVGPYLRRDDLLHGQSSLYLAIVPSGCNRFPRNNEILKLHGERNRFRFPGNNEILKLHGERNGFLVVRRRDTPQPQIYAPQIVSPLLDLSLARYWLQYCKENHKRQCSLKHKATTELHLIDCRSLEVIPAPDQADYTALSYVWGMPSAEANRSGANFPGSTVLSGSTGIPLQSPLPAVITDAINVTMGLGFHYLWVDRYCIDQDSHAKHQQINQMDLIYQNAELTIVAAAGSGPEHGLPGINSRTRCGQQTCTIGDFDIFSTSRHPHKTIQSSKWSNRAWTFQEAALSRRNLVFTDEQAYFECSAMNCHESLSSNLDKLHSKNKSKFSDILHGGLFGRSEEQKYGHFDESNLKPFFNHVRFMGLVEQYTARDLTYDTDSLNAFTGIIRKFETAQRAVNQICGVPFVRGEREKMAEDSFLDGLAWAHKATLCDDRGRPRRRPGFPSWSWAGWAGEIQYEERSHDSLSGALSSDVESVYIETGGGLKVSLSAYMDEAKAMPQDNVSPSEIHVQALALPASAFSYDISTTRSGLQVFEYSARLALSTGPWDVPDFYESLQNENQRRCIYLGHLSQMDVIMVLDACHESWSRVGLIFLDDFAWDFLKSWREFKTKSGVTDFVGNTDVGEKTTSFRLI